MVLELLTMHLAPEKLLVAARMDLADGVTGREVEALCNDIDQRLREREPMVSEVFLDPTPRPGVSPDRTVADQ